LGTQPSPRDAVPVSPAAGPVVRTAVVGCGYWGPNVIRNLSAHKRSDLRAICDLDADRVAEIQRRYPAARGVTRFDDILRDPEIDAVAICTPVHTHHELASAALEAGKHVLVEKPLTHSAASAEALVRLAEARGRVLMVDHTFVYNGAVEKIKAIIDSGTIGEVLYFDSVRISLGLFQSDLNVVWDLAAHDVSIMNYLFDRDPLWVSAVGSTHFGALENLAYVTMKFEGSLIAHLHINWLAPVKLRSTLIGGSKQMIVYDDLAPSEKIRVYDKGVTLNGGETDRARALIDYRVGDMHAPYIDKSEPLERVCSDFLEACLKGTMPRSDGRAGLRVVRVLEAAQESIKQDGNRVFLPR
jgi:predicted dehydrogenase